MKLKTTTLAALTALTLAGSASAATTIASNATSDVTNVSTYTLAGATGTNIVANDDTNFGWSLNFFLAQSFSTGTLGSDNKLSTISVATVGDVTASTLTAYLYKKTADNGNYITVESTAAATATVTLTASTGPATVTFDFSSANLTLADNSTYAFYLKPNAGQSFTWAGSSSSSAYTGGEAMVVWEPNLPSPGFWTGDGDLAGNPAGDISGDRVFSVTAVPSPPPPS